MKVILLSDVKNLGKKGSVVEVAEGYGRNYLLPHGLAAEASPGNIRQLEDEKGREQRKAAALLREARRVADILSQLELVLPVRAGEGGKLFGSVTSKDIAEAIGRTARLEVDKRKIELKEHIKALGEYKVTVRLHPEVNVDLKLNIVGL